MVEKCFLPDCKKDSMNSSSCVKDRWKKQHGPTLVAIAGKSERPRYCIRNA